ncbi:MAG TPA: hypothetical protein VK820_08180 [Steroidobacteraceae bacterium]|nr:hypothetical protein [Steroidobacteraceae bacterium]
MAKQGVGAALPAAACAHLNWLPNEGKQQKMEEMRAVLLKLQIKDELVAQR